VSQDSVGCLPEDLQRALAVSPAVCIGQVVVAVAFVEHLVLKVVGIVARIYESLRESWPRAVNESSIYFLTVLYLPR